jgi:cytochrome c553
MDVFGRDVFAPSGSENEMSFRLNGLTWLAGTALCLTLSFGAHAAGDPVLGEKKFYTCYGCHGIKDYKNAYPDYSVPKLRHQNALYIVAALQEYRSGDRPHATMHAQAASLSDQDMEDIAAYLQGPEPPKPAADAPAKPPTQVAACVACHGNNGLGVDAPLVPKPAVLAGQHVDYLEQALTSYRNGRRKNLVMAGMAQLLTTDEDVRIAATYFASQASPLVTATTGSQ